MSSRFLPVLVLALLAVSGGSFALADPAEPPPSKRTTLGLYLTAEEAYDMWKADSTNVTVLDVRTPEEYILVGHAPMAWNIPVVFFTYGDVDGTFQQGARPNPSFVSEVETVADKDDVLVLMCRSGGRSAKAVDQLAAAGYTRVYNMVEGVEGDLVKDPGSPDHGKRTVNGWKNRGLPWGYDYDPAKILIDE